MKSNKIKVVIAENKKEDVEIIKKAFKDLTDYEIVKSTTNGRELIWYLLTANKPLPHLILMDIQMPCCDGLLALIICKRLFPKIKIVGLSTHSSSEVIKEFITEGGNGFLTKIIVQKDSGLFKYTYKDIKIFENALKEVTTSNEIYFDPIIIQNENYKPQVATNKVIDKDYSNLKENEIMYLLFNAAGFTRKEIATLMDKDENTIKFYIKHLCEIFNVHSHTDLINICLNVGITKLAKVYNSYHD